MPIEPTPRNAAHLLRRAAWAGLPAEIDAVMTDGIEASVDRLLDPAGAPVVAEPPYGPGDVPYSGEVMNAWFHRLAATSPTPALERLMWFWHGHFATSLEKVEWTDLVCRQLITLRRHGLGRFDDLLMAVTLDPAMNFYLDLHMSTADAPNENYARELMELFSLGAGQGYTQSDVVQVGRAMTGYGLEEHFTSGRPVGSTLRPMLHDTGQKTIFGRTGAFDAADVIEMIVAKPECHRFVASRFWLRYAGTEAAPSVIDELASVFAASLRIDDLLRALLTHPAFYAPEVQGAVVNQPVESLVRFARGMELPFPDGLPRESEDDDGDNDDDEAFELYWYLVEAGWSMGQLVGIPPNVGGWPDGLAWIDARHATGRLNAGRQLGHLVAELDGDVPDALRAAVGNPADFVPLLLGRLGCVEWSPATEDAISQALVAEEPFEAVAAAIATAFVSPEVTLA